MFLTIKESLVALVFIGMSLISCIAALIKCYIDITTADDTGALILAIVATGVFLMLTVVAIAILLMVVEQLLLNLKHRRIK